MPKKPWRARALWALLPLLMLLTLESFARGDLGAAVLWALRRPLMTLMQYAILLGLCLLPCAFRSLRLRAAAWLLAAFLCALWGMANFYKLVYRMEPVLLSDFTQLGDAAAAVTGLDFGFDFVRLGLVCAVFLGALALCMVRLKNKRQKRSIPLALLGAALAVGVPLLCTYDLAGVSTDIMEHARNDGCLYTAFAAENNRRALLGTRYEQDEIEAAYQAAASRAGRASVTEQSPNIVLVLSEAFMDEQTLAPYLRFTRPVTPFYRSLTEECVSGRMYAPKIGGGTSETEFEVLTGLRSKYSVNPYTMGLPPLCSLASVLREKGYTATAIHWFTGVYYNRYKNLRMEGFDALYTADTTTRDFERAGYFVSDAEHYRSVMQTLRQTEGRDFVYCITMQNHGGYAYNDFRTVYGADVPFANELSPESEKILANYCYLLGRSDAALKAWIEELRAFEEPTMVVFFGDHLAPMGAEVFEELGMPVKGDAAHLTPYFIWSNQKALRGQTDLCAYQLGAYALKLAGLLDDPFLSLVEGLRQSGENEDESYNALCFDALLGEQYAYALAGCSPENEDFQIGGRMELSGFDAEEANGQIRVRPCLCNPDQRWRLSVNGRLIDGDLISPSEKPVALQCVMLNDDGRRLNESRTIEYQNTGELLNEKNRSSPRVP